MPDSVVKNEDQSRNLRIESNSFFWCECKMLKEIVIPPMVLLEGASVDDLESSSWGTASTNRVSDTSSGWFSDSDSDGDVHGGKGEESEGPVANEDVGIGLPQL
ncbi:MAG: hypothetical protein VX737_01080 [Pseudomonadota bacterium]|nr:hypothetical protein [Pseudomonadota bacterium]